MIVLEYEAVEVDFCVDCGGIWLDGGELELLFGDREITEGFLAAGDAAEANGEKPRRCPCCRKRMDKHVTRGEAPVIYDHCPVGDGLWFDRGELASVLEHGSTAPGGETVIAWLRDMFPTAETGPHADE